MCKTWNVISGNVIYPQPIFAYTHRIFNGINFFQNVTKSTFTSARNTETKKDVMSNLVPETNVSPSNRKCSPPKQKWDFAKESLATRKECFRSPIKRPVIKSVSILLFYTYNSGILLKSN